jgi:hypothetical protein
MSATPKAPTDRTLWNSGQGASSFAQVQVPANLADVVRQVADQAQREVADRVRPYETPVTVETLRTTTGT